MMVGPMDGGVISALMDGRGLRVRRGREAQTSQWRDPRAGARPRRKLGRPRLRRLRAMAPAGTRRA